MLDGGRILPRLGCAENECPRDACEAALAHAVDSKVERAYRWSDLVAAEANAKVIRLAQASRITRQNV